MFPPFLLLSYSPFCCWEQWLSPAWPLTSSSSSSTHSGFAAAARRAASSPMPTAAARPGVSSLPPSCAGELLSTCTAPFSYTLLPVGDYEHEVCWTARMVPWSTLVLIFQVSRTMEHSMEDFSVIL